MYLYHYTYNFFHNNRPGKPLPGHSSFLGLFWALFFVGGDGWREGRTDCRRGGCMVVPGAVVSPSHTKRLSLLPCRAPHNSPCTLMPYLAQTDGAYSAACGRRAPSRQVPQAPSMTSGLLRRTGSRPCSRPAGRLSVLVFGSVRCGGLTGGWWAISAALDGCRG